MVNGVIVDMTPEEIAQRQEEENQWQIYKQEWDSKQYARNRADEYPPITDYLDGVVKGDQEQIDDYIAACQAVKTKYPKPE